MSIAEQKQIKVKESLQEKGLFIPYAYKNLNQVKS